MNLLLLSDLHLNPHSEERSTLFIQFLQTALKNGDEVIIAGDLFDLWFGWRDMTFPYQKEILGQMKEVFDNGLDIVYVEGNRDFNISTYKNILFKDVFTEQTVRNWGQQRILIVHGDLINRQDKQYRLWRKVTKNPLAFGVISLTPSFLLLRWAEKLEKKLKQTNMKYRTSFPEREVNQFCIENSHHNIDIVISGHFHVEKETELHDDSKDVLFYNLPGWERGFRYLVIPPGNRKPFFQDWGP